MSVSILLDIFLKYKNTLKTAYKKDKDYAMDIYNREIEEYRELSKKRERQIQRSKKIDEENERRRSQYKKTPWIIKLFIDRPVFIRRKPVPVLLPPPSYPIICESNYTVTLDGFFNYLADYLLKEKNASTSNTKTSTD